MENNNISSSTSETTTVNTAKTDAANDNVITVTPKALKEIRRIQSQDGTAEGAYLRVQVTGGGCSGMSYKLGFDQSEPVATDKVLQFEDIRITIDSKSSLFLKGTELDFTDGLNGTGFVFSNPNAKRTCGCGSSFSV
jgi:iron-sulfur cluster assembly protein